MAEWIEIKSLASIILPLGSPLAMAEWIEIIQEIASVNAQMVSASDGGVD